MANNDDYLTYYRQFFENFAQTVNPNDQLPVKLGSYKLVNVEVVGGIIDWTNQYLTQKKCPQNLIAPLIQIVIDETRKLCKKQPTACGFNPSDNAYEPLKLMQTVMALTNEICLRYLDNSMLCSLPSPGLPHNIVSVCSAKNKRKRMEDRHVIVHDLNTTFNLKEASPSSYYAIFDGHAGHDAAAYSAAHLHQFLAESKYFASNPEQALRDAFGKTDELFIDKCNVERFNSGTTAVCALLRPKENTLYIAWVGDSQALLVNQGRVLQCVDPHKPCRTDERERIEKQGGCVCYWGTWRVNGQLAVSRAIGDADYKPYVTAVPDIREIPLDGGEDFLILACDGLWDFLSEDDAARTVYNMVCRSPERTDIISEHLIYLAKEQGSADNITVIVVFLREPTKIAAEAHWANRNASPIAMDTNVDNANNPFGNSNGTNDVISQKADGLLLNLSDNFKHNSQDSSPSADFYHRREKSNGKRLASEFDDEDLGPETDVDALDDVTSPSIAAAKALAEGLVNNNPEGSFNPFVEKLEVEKAALELDLGLQKQQSCEFDGERSPREETPTPPADTVHDGGLEDNLGDSGEDSEDEWNYIKGEEANKENISPSQPDCEVANILEEVDNMSQLNPNAAPFVPVSPTRSIPSPVCRSLIDDTVIAQSPKRPADIDISVPNLQEFVNEAKSRPSEFDSVSNGHNHENDEKTSPQDLMENLLNGKNIDEIPEFQPTPTKVPLSDEFHFGPNAGPFTLAKQLDQLEAFSTNAVYGDDSVAKLDSTLEISTDNVDFVIKTKENDPMSASFYQDQPAVDPFDLNKVQMLPDNIDEFLSKPEVESKAQDPVTEFLTDDIPLDINDRIQTTDLDKLVDDEKEVASPVSQDDDEEESGVCELSKSPQPQSEEVLRETPSSLVASPEPSAPSLEQIESKSAINLISEEPATNLMISPSLSPVPGQTEPPIPDIASSPVCEGVSSVIEDVISSELGKDVFSVLEEATSPVAIKPASPDLEEFEQPLPEQLSTHSVSPVQDQLVSILEQAVSPVPVEPVTPAEPAGDIETVVSDQERPLSVEPLEQICQSTKETIETSEKVCSLKTETSVESPFEDVTSSVKDTTSPVLSPIPDQHVQEEVTAIEHVSPVHENLAPDVVLLSTPKSVTDTESVLTADVNSFLERSQVSDITSPLSPVSQPVIDLNHPLMKCVYPLPTEVHSPATEINSDVIPVDVLPVSTDIKTENITPEFAESIVIKTPIEPVELQIEKSVEAPGITTQPAKKLEQSTKPKTPLSGKKTAAKPALTSFPAKGKPAATAKPKTLLLKSSTATAASKTSTGAVPKQLKPAPPKPKTTASTTLKPLEKKPLTNGDVKTAPIKSTLSVRKSMETTKLSPKIAPAKAIPSKPTGPKPATTTKTSTSTITSKPRPTTLSSRTSTSSVTKTTQVTNSKPTALKTTTAAPRLTSPAKPRPAPAKPRVLPTTTATKTPTETEKQIKDSTNKLTASRTATRTSAGASARTSDSTVKKIESKVSGTTQTNAAKSTMSRRPGSTGKKPLEIARTGIKAKTTKIEKPIQNGVSTVITEQITVVSTASNGIETQLQKDNSPMDNKLIVENNAD